MFNARKSTIGFLILLSFFCLSNHAAGSDSCFQGLSTITGNVNYPAGWRPYIFEFTLYDGYGTQLDNTRGVVIYYRSQSHSRRSVEYTYEAATGKFEFSIPQSYWDDGGYWISYTCSYEGTPVGLQGGGIETQYPGKVWSTEKEFPADKIQGGAYSDTVHFFNATGLPDDIDYQIFGGYDCPEDLGPDGRAFWYDNVAGRNWYYLAPNKAAHRYLEVESSCSYRVSCTDFTESSSYVDDQYKYWDGDDEIWECRLSGSVGGEILADFEVMGPSRTQGPSLSGVIHTCTITNVTPTTMVGDYDGSPVTWSLDYARFRSGVITFSADIP